MRAQVRLIRRGAVLTAAFDGGAAVLRRATGDVVFLDGIDAWAILAGHGRRFGDLAPEAAAVAGVDDAEGARVLSEAVDRLTTLRLLVAEHPDGASSASSGSRSFGTGTVVVSHGRRLAWEVLGRRVTVAFGDADLHDRILELHPDAEPVHGTGAADLLVERDGTGGVYLTGNERQFFGRAVDLLERFPRVVQYEVAQHMALPVLDVTATRDTVAGVVLVDARGERDRIFDGPLHGDGFDVCGLVALLDGNAAGRSSRSRGRTGGRLLDVDDLAAVLWVGRRAHPLDAFHRRFGPREGLRRLASMIVNRRGLDDAGWGLLCALAERCPVVEVAADHADRVLDSAAARGRLDLAPGEQRLVFPLEGMVRVSLAPDVEVAEQRVGDARVGFARRARGRLVSLDPVSLAVVRAVTGGAALDTVIAGADSEPGAAPGRDVVTAVLQRLDEFGLTEGTEPFRGMPSLAPWVDWPDGPWRSAPSWLWNLPSTGWRLHPGRVAAMRSDWEIEEVPTTRGVGRVVTFSNGRSAWVEDDEFDAVARTLDALGALDAAAIPIALPWWCGAEARVGLVPESTADGEPVGERLVVAALLPNGVLAVPSAGGDGCVRWTRHRLERLGGLSEDALAALAEVHDLGVVQRLDGGPRLDETLERLAAAIPGLGLPPIEPNAASGAMQAGGEAGSGAAVPVRSEDLVAWGRRVGEVYLADESAKIDERKVVWGRPLYHVVLRPGGDGALPTPEVLADALADVGMPPVDVAEAVGMIRAAGEFYVAEERASTGEWRRKVYVECRPHPIPDELFVPWRARFDLPADERPSWVGWKFRSGASASDPSIDIPRLAGAPTRRSAFDRIVKELPADWAAAVEALVTSLGIDLDAPPSPWDALTRDLSGRRSIDLAIRFPGPAAEGWLHEAALRRLFAVAGRSREDIDAAVAWAAQRRYANVIVGPDGSGRPFVNLYLHRPEVHEARL